MNNLHKRPSLSPLRQEDYESAENGEYSPKQEKEFVGGNSEYYRISKTSVFSVLFYGILFMLLFAGYMEIKSGNERKAIHSSIHRKLNTREHLTIEKSEMYHCNKGKDTTVIEHVECYTEQVPVLIISDYEDDRNILDQYELREKDIHYMNLFDIFEKDEDIIIFLKYFDTQAPWIFVEGKYIGGKKDLNEYNEYLILDNGIENAEFHPQNLIKNIDNEHLKTSEQLRNRKLRNYFYRKDDGGVKKEFKHPESHPIPHPKVQEPKDDSHKILNDHIDNIKKGQKMTELINLVEKIRGEEKV